MKSSVAVLTIWLFLTGIGSLPCGAQQGNPSLDEGIRQYRKGNFEEAIVALTKAREVDPDATLTAFFLGMAYKEAMDYENALPHLEDAVSKSPRIREALVPWLRRHVPLPDSWESGPAASPIAPATADGGASAAVVELLERVTTGVDRLSTLLIDGTASGKFGHTLLEVFGQGLTIVVMAANAEQSEV